MNSSGLCDETETDVLIAMNGNLAHRRRFAKSRSKHWNQQLLSTPDVAASIARKLPPSRCALRRTSRRTPRLGTIRVALPDGLLGRLSAKRGARLRNHSRRAEGERNRMHVWPGTSGSS